LQIKPSMTDVDESYAAQVQRQLDNTVSGVPFGPDNYTCLPAAVLSGAAVPQFGAIQIANADPKTVTVDFETTGSLYRIRLDGRHQPPDPKFPHPFGDTTGRWESDVLVADSLADETAKDSRPPAKPAAQQAQADHQLDVTAYLPQHIVQRFQRLSMDVLEDRITFENPKAWPKPVSVTVSYKRQSGVKPDKINCYIQR
jgi:hypothetical protein